METSPPVDAVCALVVELSAGARGVSSPNPPVGAVVLDADGRIVGRGATEAAGGAHAEVVALDEAGQRARGGTLVVTLEPCHHHGRTGPCTWRILDAGIAAVRYGHADPNPVAAGGADALREAGLTVQRDTDLAAAAYEPMRAWLFRQRTGRPLVRWKYAATLDGRVAAADGSSRWITGPGARAHAHEQRERADAIIVGSGTVRADDPSLSARFPDGSPRPRSPIACAMGRGEVPRDAAIRRSPGGFRHLATRDPAEALAALPDALTVIVEGGPTLGSAFLRAGLVDEIDAYLAPTILGAGDGVVTDLGVSTLSAAHRFALVDHHAVGADVHLHLRRPELTGPGAHPQEDERTCSRDS